MMLPGKRRDKEPISEQQLRSSRLAYLNQEDSRYSKSDFNNNINGKLAKNFNQIVELLKHRKELILRKIGRLYEQNAQRIELISRGRMQDLKNEAKLLRDESITSLVDNSDRINNTKSLLKRITDQLNFTQFQSMQKAKGKRYFERCREVDSDINTRSKKFNLMIEELQKLNEKERQMYNRLEERENDMRVIMKRRQGDYMRKVEQIETQLQKYRVIIRENKVVKDRRKKEIQNVLGSLLDTLISHQEATLGRVSDIDDLFGGCHDVHDFDLFIKQFQSIIASKYDEKKDGKKDAAVQELIKLTNGYQAYVEQLHKDRHFETVLLEDINDGLRTQLKLGLIEKVYFQEISNDRSKLNQALRKCKNYKTLLDNFEGERTRLSKEINRVTSMKSSFGPRLKALSSQDMRREELRRQLNGMMDRHNQVALMAKKYKDFDNQLTTYVLARQILQKDIDELADQGNISEYKVKVADLQSLERQYKQKSSNISGSQYERAQSQFNSAVQNLYSRYADIIQDILVQDERMSPSDLIAKLSKRINIS